MAVVLVFVVLASFTWARWGDLRIDAGREMYLPAAIVGGKMLYRDLWYPYGPLAPYWNALLFFVFGSHLYVLYFSGLAVTLSFALVLFAVSRRFLAHTSAFVVVFCFLMQAFRPHPFNYVLPYAFAATLGSLFGLLFLYFLVRYILGEAGPNLIAAGTAAGLSLLSKQEMGAACYFTFVIVLMCQATAGRSARWLITTSLRFLPGLLLNIGIYGWFVWRTSLSFLFLENFTIVPGSDFMRVVGSRWIERHGLRFVPQELLGAALTVVLSLSVWFVLAFALSRALVWRWTLPFLAAGLAGFVLAARFLSWELPRVLQLYGLPFVLFPMGSYWLAWVLLVLALVRWWRRGYEQRHFALAVVCIYGVAVGVRIMAEVFPTGYSIYYDSVLFLAFVIVLTRIAAVAGKGSPPARQAMLVTTVLALEGLGLLAAMYPRLEERPAMLRTSRGTIYTLAGEAAAFPKVISFIERQKALGKTVLILPDETSLYYFSGTQAPTRWYWLLPGTLAPQREREYIAQVEAKSIDYILLSNRSTEEYGLPFFGLDYNQLVYQWIEANYEAVGEFGHFSRNAPKEFGMLIYRRRAGEAGKANTVGARGGQ